MFSDRALADYDAQIRQSTQADEPGTRAEADFQVESFPAAGDIPAEIAFAVSDANRAP